MTRAAIERDFGDNHRLMIFEDGPERGQVRLATGFIWDERSEGDMYLAGDGISRANDVIQAIVNAAWERGFRPHGFTDVKNETTAIKAHLDDMRAITFHKLGMK